MEYLVAGVSAYAYLAIGIYLWKGSLDNKRYKVSDREKLLFLVVITLLWPILLPLAIVLRPIMDGFDLG
jgi:hypothetical protein